MIENPHFSDGGPASREPAVLDAPFLSRARRRPPQLSHEHDTHAETFRRVERPPHARAVVAILQDLQGPKIRLGKLDGEMRVAPDQTSPSPRVTSSVRWRRSH